MKTVLSDTEQVVYKAILDYINQHGQSPLISELADITGITYSTVVTNLYRLEVAGLIRKSRKRRSIQVLNSDGKPDVPGREQIEMLLDALRPFARAGEGFTDPGILLRYKEADGLFYELYYGDGPFDVLTSGDLLNAAEVLAQLEGEIS